jgi:threonine/homoserine/homoserine lactone efflux protein
MPDALWAGIIAGYGIAIPVGPISVLILQLAVSRGFRPAAAAAAGAASADLSYAVLAALFGAALAGLLEPIIVPARIVGAVVLTVIGLRGLVSALRVEMDPASTVGQSASVNHRRTYLTFLALTATNPMTFLYFAALIIGLPALEGGAGARLVFAVGAFAASLSWQLLLAGVGSAFHHRLSPRVERWTRIGGSLIVLAFAAWIAFQAAAGVSGVP